MKIEIEVADIETTAKALNNAVAAFGEICHAVFMNCEVPAKFEGLKSLDPDNLMTRFYIVKDIYEQVEAMERKYNNAY
jgi:hypothetical protein